MLTCEVCPFGVTPGDLDLGRYWSIHYIGVNVALFKTPEGFMRVSHL